MSSRIDGTASASRTMPTATTDHQLDHGEALRGLASRLRRAFEHQRLQHRLAVRGVGRAAAIDRAVEDVAAVQAQHAASGSACRSLRLAGHRRGGDGVAGGVDVARGPAGSNRFGDVALRPRPSVPRPRQLGVSRSWPCWPASVPAPAAPAPMRPRPPSAGPCAPNRGSSATRSAPRTPMTATTIINSISVKPGRHGRDRPTGRGVGDRRTGGVA